MSRIDEALRIRERASGVVASEPEASRPNRSSPLVEYQSEEAVRHVHDVPASSRVAEMTPPRRPAAAAPRIATAGATRQENADLQARLVTSTSSTVSLEQYRRLAAGLLDWQVESQSKTIMITSALPHEGKTLTVVNLALTLSESYARRVLVIDADLRAPGVHTLLGIPNDRGLSEALGADRYELRYAEVSSQLSVMTAGRPGEAPLAGLTSSRMREVLEDCAARFDWVLIDTPPVGVLPDAQVLVRLVGGILLVIAAGSTPAAAVERAIAEFGGPEAIIGTVLNRVDEQTIPEAVYYGRYGYVGRDLGLRGTRTGSRSRASQPAARRPPFDAATARCRMLNSASAHSEFHSGPSGLAYNEAAFRHFLAVDRSRARQSRTISLPGPGRRPRRRWPAGQAHGRDGGRAVSRIGLVGS